MYKLKVEESKYGFLYIITLNDHEIHRGFRVDQHRARLDGIEDLNLCRHFRVGQ